jgi:hydroxymethylpyrimidine pyrophosphatase-like HAD family hydrolase
MNVVQGTLVPHSFWRKWMKNILCVDMDNTIIYSYKHDIGEKKLNVELYNGREISFISERTYSLLKEVNDKMLIVPTSTRTEEQYRRINLHIGAIPYALVCNGGVLLVNGERDKEWYYESLKMIAESRPQLDKAIGILEVDPRRKFEVRFIDELFVFTKCEKPDEVIKDLNKTLKTELVDVFHNGEKVYVVPKKLNKGMAVKRLRKKMNPGYILAAGDSEFDVSMVEESDFGCVPDGFGKMFRLKADLKEDLKENVMEMESGKLFSEALLEKCLKKEAELT